MSASDYKQEIRLAVKVGLVLGIAWITQNPFVTMVALVAVVALA